MTVYGAGTSPFGSGPAGLPWTDEYVSTRTQVVASRRVDANGRFVQLTDGTGGFVAENDVAHRIIMMLGRFRPDGNIGAKGQAEFSAEVRRLLLPLTSSQEPVAKIVGILFEDSGRAAASFTVRWKDLTDGQIKVLKVTQ